jgi:FHA domain
MNDRNSHYPRTVAIPDHLWQLFEEMAEKMGTDRDGLVCQAMFVFARLNGFIDAPAVHQTLGMPSVPASGPTPVTGQPMAMDVRDRPGSAEPTGPMPTTGALPTATADDTAALSAAQAFGRVAPDDGLEVERGQLYVLTESGSLDRVVKDRFVIGRGKHCDFVIHSGKVSREHAVVVRESSTDWFIEDLGSSNGTWFNKQRVKRRRVEDGDEYYICNEKIKFVLR